jgi:positive regulator of sigma E activity
MRKVDHAGTVVGISGDKATIEIKVAGQCSTFAYRCACCRSLEAEPKRIRVPRGELQEGDVVCISIPAYNSYLRTFVVLGLPLILFVVGAAAGWFVEGRTGVHDMGIIIGGVCGFVAAVIGATIVNRKLSDAANCDVRRVKEVEA